MAAIRKEKFTVKKLNALREQTKKPYWIEGPMEPFWRELEEILRIDPSKGRWKKLRGNDITGDVWRCDIGEYRHKHTVHRFSWMYVESSGEVIGEHGHDEPANRGKQKRKIKEWYVFPDGRIEVCLKGETHKLVNNYGKPIYVLSIKAGSNGNR